MKPVFSFKFLVLSWKRHLTQNLKGGLLMIACVAVITLGFFYGILAEQDLRDLKKTAGYRTWLHERALAEHYADRAGR